MKIALIGYGKMGQIIERIAKERGHEIVAKLDSKSDESAWKNAAKADVAVEFTRPESAAANLKKCASLNLKVVCGTTGWFKELPIVSEAFNQVNGSLFWASNFSIGVNLFWQVNKKLAEIMSKHPEYSSRITEIHHIQKLDKPSGTAITIAEQIIANHRHYNQWKLDSDGNGVIPIEAIREGDVNGTHVVKYESNVDIIELSHEAKSREGFALGALFAAEFINDKVGVFTMKDLLAES